MLLLLLTNKLVTCPFPVNRLCRCSVNQVAAEGRCVFRLVQLRVLALSTHATGAQSASRHPSPDVAGDSPVPAGPVF